MNKREIVKVIIVVSVVLGVFVTLVGFWYPAVNSSAILLLALAAILQERLVHARIVSEQKHRWRLQKRLEALEEGPSQSVAAALDDDGAVNLSGTCPEDEESESARYLQLAPIYARIANLEARGGRND